MFLTERSKVDYKLEAAHFNALSKHFRFLQRQATEQGDTVAAEKHACVSHQYRERAHACMTFSVAMGSNLVPALRLARPHSPFEFNLLNRGE